MRTKWITSHERPRNDRFLMSLGPIEGCIKGKIELGLDSTQNRFKNSICGIKNECDHIKWFSDHTWKEVK